MQFLPLSMQRHAPAAHASPLRGSKTAASFKPTFVAAVVAFVVAGTFFADRAANAGVIGDIMALVLAYIFQMIAMGLGQLLLIVINALIWVYQYNGFVTAAPVANGWTIVRDVTNMFFILVLLVIAFGTILGVQNYSYKNNNALARLLIMAVVVNFSRTICGLLIDFAQVVMLTFVYGFKEAAGGNFASALSLTQMMQAREITESNSASGGSGGDVTAWNIALAMLLAAIMVGIALVVVILMTITVAIRIIYLWLLVVISPLAFFLKAVPGGAASGYYAMWWKMFTSQVIVGPVMAFFLWLALVSVSSNTLASDGFPRSASGGTGAETVSGPISQAFTDTAIESFIISICLLFGGLQLAKQISSESANMSSGIAKKAASVAMRGGKAIGRTAANATGVTAGYNAAKEKALSLGTRVPLVSTAAGKALGEHRQRMGSAGADNAKWLGQLTQDERRRMTKSTLPDAMLSPEARGLKKEALRANVKDMADKGAKTDAEKKEFFQQRSQLESLGNRMGDKSVFSDVKGLYKKRPDLIVNPDEKDAGKLKSQRDALKRAAGSLGAKDLEEMDGSAFTPAVLANLNPNALLGARDALRTKLSDMPEKSRTEMGNLLSAMDKAEATLESEKDDKGNRVYSDKEIGRRLRNQVETAQGQFRADSVSSLTDEDRAGYFGTLNKDTLSKMPAEALGSALVAAAASAPNLSGGDLDRLNVSMDRMAQALASQPQAVEKLPSTLKDNLRDALVSGNTYAPSAVLAAGGTVEQAFKGYDRAGGFKDDASREKFQQYIANPDNAKAVASTMNASALMDQGGGNDIAKALAQKISAEDIVGMAKSGRGDNAMAMTMVMEMHNTQTFNELGGMKDAAAMTFSGQAKEELKSLVQSAASAPGRVVGEVKGFVGSKMDAVKNEVKDSVQRGVDSARKINRTRKRI